MTPRHFGILGPIRQNGTFFELSFIYQKYQLTIDFQYVAEILTLSNPVVDFRVAKRAIAQGLHFFGDNGGPPPLDSHAFLSINDCSRAGIYSRNPRIHDALCAKMKLDSKILALVVWNSVMCRNIVVTPFI